jgi:hypothetical protein
MRVSLKKLGGIDYLIQLNNLTSIPLKITIFIFKVRININYKIFIYIDKDSLKDDFKMN